MPSKNTSVPKTINHRSRIKQAVVFENLSLGATDLDGVIEYHELCYVLFELKFKDTPLPEGQRLALVRMCDDLQKSKPTLLIIATHEAPPGTDVDAASARVVRYRYMGEWHSCKRPYTVKQMTDKFLAKYGGFST
jgi:hypothetical protein